MGLFLDNDLIELLRPHLDGDGISHGSRGDEEGCVFSHDPGRAGLKILNRRVVAENIIADHGFGHGPAHCVRGPGDGIAAEIRNSHDGSSKINERSPL